MLRHSFENCLYGISYYNYSGRYSSSVYWSISCFFSDPHVLLEITLWGADNSLKNNLGMGWESVAYGENVAVAHPKWCSLMCLHIIYSILSSTWDVLHFTFRVNRMLSCFILLSLVLQTSALELPLLAVSGQWQVLLSLCPFFLDLLPVPIIRVSMESYREFHYFFYDHPKLCHFINSRTIRLF